ncbi:MAG TPA: hypothetical protein VM008_06525, partial [Phycisphaerae bacterium]|nr:hypothetical protein [Phycisphaerae bacterium]
MPSLPSTRNASVIGKFDSQPSPEILQHPKHPKTAFPAQKPTFPPLQPRQSRQNDGKTERNDAERRGTTRNDAILPPLSHLHPPYPP